MAVARRSWLLQLSRSADQRPCTGRVPAPCRRPLAAHAAASQPQGLHHVGTDDAAGGGLAPETDHPSSLAELSLRRHTPKVGAVCGKAARTVLCGGRAMKRTSLPLHRRDLITLLGGATAAWPLAAHAQQAERVRRIGVLANLAEDDLETRSRNAVVLRGLQELGWIEGRNVRIDYRFALGNMARLRQYAAELVALAPDVILATGQEATGALQQATRTVPIVFVLVPDPVGGGFVDSLARPGGNVTGFTPFEFGISAKWLEWLKEIAPGVKRVAVLRDAAVPEVGQFAIIQATAPSFGVDVSPISARDASEIERAITTFARSSNGGLIVPGSALAAVHRDRIAALAALNKLPAVYVTRFFVTAGGLISYGPDFVDQYRRAASYIDRILKGAKPADLPVQVPTKYQLVINLKTAKTLGLTVP